MLRVALTGGIATGKSHVLVRFAARNVPTIDADLIARDVVRPGRPAWAALRAQFGAEVFTASGDLDRKRLASRVFDDAAARADLEAIVHPHVRSAIDVWFQDLERSGTTRLALADIPLLFETDRATDFDRVIVTSCDTDTQLTRLVERDGLSKDDGRRRLAAQLSTAVKTAQADFVIYTDGSFAETERQVEDAYRALCQQ